MGGALSGLVTEKSVPLKSIEKLFSGYQSQPSTECPIAGDSGGRLAASAVPQKELVEPRDQVLQADGLPRGKERSRPRSGRRKLTKQERGFHAKMLARLIMEKSRTLVV